jgi:hypothetical protein
MGPQEALYERVELARTQAKRVEREARIMKQMLAGIADELSNLQPDGQKETHGTAGSHEQG